MPTETEGRWPLPKGWRWMTVGEIAKVVGGGTPKASVESNFAEPGSGVAWITPADLTGYDEVFIGSGRRDLSPGGLKGSSARVLPKGAVLFSSRAPVGYCAVAANPIATNQGFKSLVLKPGLDPEFVRLYLLASTEYAELAASGTTFKELSGARMKGLLVPVAPEQEQERIVTHYNAIEAHRRVAKEKLDHLPDLLDRYRQSVLAAAFRGDLTAAWREAHPDTEPATALLERIRAERRRRWIEDKAQKSTDRAQARDAKKGKTWTDAARAARLGAERAKAEKKYEPLTEVHTGELAGLPHGWFYSRIQYHEHSRRPGIKTGPFGSLLKKHEHVQKGVPVVGIENIGKMAFLAGSKIHVEPEKAEDLCDYDVQAGDILISRSGTVGEVCVAPDDLGETRFSTNIMRVVLNRDTMLPEFLGYMILGSTAVQLQIQDLCSGSTRDFLNKTILQQLALPTPPLDEQVEIVRAVKVALEGVEVLLKTASRLRDHADTLRQSTLARAFRGELVPTDADLARRDGLPAGATAQQGRGEAQTALDL